MSRMLVMPAVLLLITSTAPAGGDKDKENPYRNAKVGDYINYKTTMLVADKSIEGSMKQLVTAADEKTVTVKAVVMLLGQKKETPAETIDLSKPFDPTSVINQAGKVKGTFEKSGEGKEKIKVNGKEYDCTWLAGKVTAGAGGFKIESDVKVWFCTAIPLNGMIKMESKMNLLNTDTTTIFELAEFGNSKDKDK